MFCLGPLIYCTDMLLYIFQNSKCFCISDKPEINSDVNDCRTVCTNVSYTPCSSGRSSMVFSFVEGIYNGRLHFIFQFHTIFYSILKIYCRHLTFKPRCPLYLLVAIVFVSFTDINIPTTNTYIEQECVTVNKGQNRFTVSDCNAHYFYGCRNTSCKVFTIYRKNNQK